MSTPPTVPAHLRISDKKYLYPSELTPIKLSRFSGIFTVSLQTYKKHGCICSYTRSIERQASPYTNIVTISYYIQLITTSYKPIPYISCIKSVEDLNLLPACRVDCWNYSKLTLVIVSPSSVTVQLTGLLK